MDYKPSGKPRSKMFKWRLSAKQITSSRNIIWMLKRKWSPFLSTCPRLRNRDKGLNFFILFFFVWKVPLSVLLSYYFTCITMCPHTIHIQYDKYCTIISPKLQNVHNGIRKSFWSFWRIGYKMGQKFRTWFHYTEQSSSSFCRVSVCVCACVCVFVCLFVCVRVCVCDGGRADG